MKNDAPEAPVGAVLNALRNEVRARRAALAPTSEATPLKRELERCAEQLEITRVVSAHWPLGGGSLPQRATAFVNKLVRRALRWYINPIVEQQNAFNDVAVRSVRLLIEAYSELRMQNAECRTPNDMSEPPDSPDTPNEQHGGRADSPNAPTTLGDGAILNSQFSILPFQQAIQLAGENEPPAPLTDLGLLPLALSVADRSHVAAHWALDAGTLPGRARSLTQKLVRRGLRWLINPIVEQQNAFNAALAATIPQLVAADAELRAALATQRWSKKIAGSR